MENGRNGELIIDDAELQISFRYPFSIIHYPFPLRFRHLRREPARRAQQARIAVARADELHADR
jgi:hypothetical protein